MRYLIILLALAGCTSTTPDCRLDDGVVDTCMAVPDGAGFKVQVTRGHETWELTAPSFATKEAVFPTGGVLQYTNPTGATCRAFDGAANWMDDGVHVHIDIDSTCGYVHTITVPLYEVE